MNKNSGTCVEHFGHTSFAISHGDEKVLIDPILVRRDLRFRRSDYPEWFAWDPRNLSAVLLSHGHDDHLHPPSLLSLPPDIPIYFLDEDLDTCSCDEPPELLLANLGFENRHPFRPGDSLEIGEITTRILPSKPSVEGEEQCCFLFETPDVRVLNAVDIKDSPTTRSALEPYRKEIDLAFVPTGAALQWQGFWNQMDTIEALSFCAWLKPDRVATCGGALSLSDKPHPGILERYPKGLADWLMTAGHHLHSDQLLRQEPPFRLHYEAHSLSSCTTLRSTNAFQSRTGLPSCHAMLATFFTGYHPHTPTKKIAASNGDIAGWLEALEDVEGVIRSSAAGLRNLVQRCGPAANGTPAGILAACTLRYLTKHSLFDLAAQLSSLIPPRPANPAELELSFFATAEALLENAAAEPSSREELSACLWIDRQLYLLGTVHAKLRDLANVPQSAAERLRAEHVEDLRATASQRRPLLDANHFLLDAEQIPLLTGEPAPQNCAALLCYASPAGVRSMALVAVELMFLNACDGRTFEEIAEDISQALRIDLEEARDALFEFLSRLTEASIVLIDWSS